MKILHFGKYYPPYFGGVEKVNFDLVEKLNKEYDCQVDELCFCHSPGYEESFYPVGYKLYRVPIFGVKFSTPLPRGLVRTLWKVRKDYDIVHVHVPNPVAVIATFLLPSKTKIVVHWHSDIVKQKLLLKFFRPFQTVFLKRASAIIGTSHNYVEGSSELRPFLPKVSVVPIGLDIAEMKYSDDDVRRIRDKYKGKKIILCIGRLTTYKGHKYLIEAAKQLGSDCVILIGGVGELQAELKRQIMEHAVDGKVILLGRIPQNLIYAYYAAADVFCLPSITKAEAFGVVLIEALAMGTPIVTCNIKGSGVTWVNEDGVTGYNVCTENARELAEKITKIITDEKLRTSMSANCRERFNQLFTIDTMVGDVFQLYKRLV